MWLMAGAFALAGAVVLGVAVHPFVGSGLSCEGIGWGCTPERDVDTALVVAVYCLGAATTLLAARVRARRGRGWRAVLASGIAITAALTAAAVWLQLPDHPASPGPLGPARERWESVLADGMAVAPPGTPLGDALRGLERRGPLECRDAYRRRTGARRFRWSGRAGSDAGTAAALGRWAERLRARGVGAIVSDPSGDPASDRRLQVGRFGVAAGGVLTVRASSYISTLEIQVTTGCHRG